MDLASRFRTIGPASDAPSTSRPISPDDQSTSGELPTARWRPLIERVSSKLGMDPVNLETVMYLATGGADNGSQEADAVGLMRINPRIWSKLCDSVSLTHGLPNSIESWRSPEVNVEIGARELKWWTEEKCDGDAEGGSHAYFTGHCVPSGSTDSTRKTGGQYLDIVREATDRVRNDRTLERERADRKLGTERAGADRSPGERFAVGEKIVVVDGPLRRRELPGLSGEILGLIPIGSIATVIAGPEAADGYGWIQIRSVAGIEGWVAAECCGHLGQGDGSNPTDGMGSPADPRWARVNQWDSVVAQVSEATDVPANVIKAIMMIESQGVLDAMSPLTNSGHYFGLMQVGAASAVPEYMKSQSWMRGNAHNQILAGATEMKTKYAAIGASNWTQAAGAYFGYGADVTGTTTEGYMGMFNQNLRELKSAMGPPPGPPTASTFTSGDQIAQKAMEFVGEVPYVLGGIPGKGDEPMRYGGWDCSGFLYWLDQNPGSEKLEKGSHYQYQQMQDEARLFDDLDQLVPGDFAFFDTGDTTGAGWQLNGAGHVSLFSGDGMMVHAASPGAGTVVTRLWENEWYIPRFIGGAHWPWSGGTAFFFSIGEAITVVDPPLSFRDGPGLGTAILAALALGTELVVEGGPDQADGYDWYKVRRSDDTTGWVAGNFCQKAVERAYRRPNR